VGDNADAFPNDPAETKDSDGDGVGDNADVFPDDASETNDSDTDGVGDNADACPYDGKDQFDRDGDGVCDYADCDPEDASVSLDSDRDGVCDRDDFAPNDSSETKDTDKDGVGDNADAFPYDPNEQIDRDADGVGDNADISICPDEKAAITDENFEAARNLWFDNSDLAVCRYGHISNWNVAAVTSLYKGFDNRPAFNEDLNSWQVSNVKSLKYAFWRSPDFNSPLDAWDVSKVESFSDVFRGVDTCFFKPKPCKEQYHAYNQDINSWNTSNGKSFARSFFYSEFNQPLDNWKVSSATEFKQIFRDTTAFDQPLDNWDISTGEKVDEMFKDALAFNQPVNHFEFGPNVCASCGIDEMFRGAVSFNQPVDQWDMTKIATAEKIFNGATSFNQPLDAWDMSSVTDMNRAFQDATGFNQWESLSCWRRQYEADPPYDTVDTELIDLRRLRSHIPPQGPVHPDEFMFEHSGIPAFPCWYGEAGACSYSSSTGELTSCEEVPPAACSVCKTDTTATCKMYEFEGVTTVHAMCGGTVTKKWGIGDEGETKAIKNCNFAAKQSENEEWGACGSEPEPEPTEQPEPETEQPLP